MKNKMAIDKKAHLSTTESKNQLANKKSRDRILVMESILMAARWEGAVGDGRRGEGIKKHQQVVTEYPRGCNGQYRKWSSHRTYMHGPGT